MIGAQVREARRLLRWSADRLNSECSIPSGVVQQFEKMDRIPRAMSLSLQTDRWAIIKSVLEAAGIEFIEPSGQDLGVRLRKTNGNRMTTTPQPVDQTTRDLVAAVRAHVSEAMRNLLRMQMQGDEAATNAYAAACMEYLPRRLEPLVAAHDALGAALNAACPDAEPVISLSTEEPA